MPFTGSHPAAVLPFLGSPLPMSALVAGSMAPDSPSYLPASPFGYAPTHSLVGGIGPNLALGLALWAVWHALLSGPALAAAPAAVRERCGHLRIGVRARLRRPVDLLLVPSAVVVGASTHVVWDNFTHLWGWPAHRIPAMHAEHLGFAGWIWAQVLCSVAGLALIAGALCRAWRRAPISPLPPQRWSLRLAPATAWLLIGAASAVGALRGLQLAALYRAPLASVPWFVLTRAIALAVCAGVALALLWHLRRAPRLLRLA